MRRKEGEQVDCFDGFMIGGPGNRQRVLIEEANIVNSQLEIFGNFGDETEE